jgi:hypothetical protein
MSKVSTSHLFAARLAQRLAMRTARLQRDYVANVVDRRAKHQMTVTRKPI